MSIIINKIRNNSGIFGNMASLGILQIANYIIPIIVIPFIVRGLGVDKFGVVSYAQNIISYFTIIVTYGFEWLGYHYEWGMDNQDYFLKKYPSEIKNHIIGACLKFSLNALKKPLIT